MQRLPTEPEFKRVTADTIYEFRGVGPNEKIHLPELPENRKCTDVCCLGFLAVVLCGWIAFSVYVATRADLRFILNDKDDCGNICGVNNKESNVYLYGGKNCTKEDYTDYPILLYERWNSTSFEKKCIKADDCKDDKKLDNGQCYSKENGNSSLSGIYKINWVTIGLIFLLSIALNYLVIMCFRINVKITYWTVTAFNFLILFVVSFWWYYAIASDRSIGNIIAAVLMTHLVLLLLVFLYLFRKKFHLIFSVYEETMKTIFNCPILLTVPLLSVTFNLLLHIIFRYMLILALSTDYVTPSVALMAIYILVLVVVYYWMYHFTTGCQCTIIAGIIAAHYFCRNKSELKSPILTSFQVLVRYHLGSVALGSTIITIISSLRCCVDHANHPDPYMIGKFGAVVCVCFLSCLEKFLQYLSKKAYMMMAIHGQNFYKSAVRAVKLMWHFLMDIIATDLIGVVAMNTGAVFTVLLSLTVGHFIGKSLVDDVDEHFAGTIAVGFTVAVIITFYFCSLINVALETTFLSFCEDKLLNDGSQQRPYFMSARLREIVEDGWKIIAEKREKQEERLRRERTLF